MFDLPACDLWHYLKASNRPIVLYGMGNGADAIINELEKYNITPSGVFASNGFVRGHSFHGFTVTDFLTAKKAFPDMIVLVSFGSQLPEVMKTVTTLDAESYAPDVPVCGGDVFTLDYCKAHLDEIKSVYDLLADEQSKKAFEANIIYKLTGRMDVLKGSESSEEEMLSLLKLSNNEKYLDLGAYNGDTVKKFIAHTATYKAIVALEPDKRSFKKLEANTQGIKGLTVINGAIKDRCGRVSFSNKGSRSSKTGEGTEIDAYSIDFLGNDFSFIKMDVEGEEANAIAGGAQNIKNGAKLLVSAYHKSEDIFALPLRILQINPNYKVYLRHLPYIPAWDTNYIFTEE